MQVVIKVVVKLFAQHRAAAGLSEVKLELPTGATARDAVTAVAAAHDQLDPRGSMVAVNAHYARPDHELSDGDEVAILPPVSGG